MFQLMINACQRLPISCSIRLYVVSRTPDGVSASHAARRSAACPSPTLGRAGRRGAPMCRFWYAIGRLIRTIQAAALMSLFLRAPRRRPTMTDTMSSPLPPVGWSGATTHTEGWQWPITGDIHAEPSVQRLRGHIGRCQVGVLLRRGVTRQGSTRRRIGRSMAGRHGRERGALIGGHPGQAGHGTLGTDRPTTRTT